MSWVLEEEEQTWIIFFVIQYSIFGTFYTFLHYIAFIYFHKNEFLENFW